MSSSCYKAQNFLDDLCKSSYHPSEAALTTFCEDALCIIKQFLVNASSLKERIGALYLTYGVYYKMPIKQLKIRMTLSDWSCLMELHSQIKQEEYHDANYILCKMIVDRIFIHCISDRELTVLSKEHERKKRNKNVSMYQWPNSWSLTMRRNCSSVRSQLENYADEKDTASIILIYIIKVMTLIDLQQVLGGGLRYKKLLKLQKRRPLPKICYKLLRIITLIIYVKVKVISAMSFKYGIERHFYEKQEQPKLDVNLMPEIKELAAPEKLLSTISKLSKVYEEKKRTLYDAEGDSSLQLYDASIADNIVDNIRTIQSESRIFVKSFDVKNPSSSKPSTASAAAALTETVQKGQKRIRVRKNQVLSKIGRAFEKGLQSEEESETEQEDTYPVHPYISLVNNTDHKRDKTFLDSYLEVNDSDCTVNGHVHSYPVVQPQRYGTMRSCDDTSDVSVMFSPVLRSHIRPMFKSYRYNRLGMKNKVQGLDVLEN
ncbi:hypothetical protein G5I_08256 [Acromyrmex echinatior]|uniref:snRNA-activating protein complex subunit 1 n=1 Tax=Acromyrmex echinatior TaxID=103372 RepID=F4WR08_ACREC|nr:hypothetical protein G5I_08256 [Acromyrmex echinatior]